MSCCVWLRYTQALLYSVGLFAHVLYVMASNKPCKNNVWVSHISAALENRMCHGCNEEQLQLDMTLRTEAKSMAFLNFPNMCCPPPHNSSFRQLGYMYGKPQSYFFIHADRGTWFHTYAALSCISFWVIRNITFNGDPRSDRYVFVELSDVKSWIFIFSWTDTWITQRKVLKYQYE